MPVLGLLACLLSSVVVPAAATTYDAQGWWSARGTFYGAPDDPWSIHRGSCGYGYVDSNVGTGNLVCAMSDCNSDFGASCGRCLEVKCDPGSVQDNYGGVFDRNHVCYAAGESVIVQIVDDCPCNYPKNAYSNRRWCCGDQYHLDLSVWAFERLADTKWGVLPLKVRSVSCGNSPARLAPVRGYKSPDYYPRPAGYSDNRPRHTPPRTSDTSAQEHHAGVATSTLCTLTSFTTRFTEAMCPRAAPSTRLPWSWQHSNNTPHLAGRLLPQPPQPAAAPQAATAGAWSSPGGRSDARPSHMHFLTACRRIRSCTVSSSSSVSPSFLAQLAASWPGLAYLSLGRSQGVTLRMLQPLLALAPSLVALRLGWLEDEETGLPAAAPAVALPAHAGGLQRAGPAAAAATAPQPGAAAVLDAAAAADALQGQAADVLLPLGHTSTDTDACAAAAAPTASGAEHEAGCSSSSQGVSSAQLTGSSSGSGSSTPSPHDQHSLVKPHPLPGGHDSPPIPGTGRD
ncbi:MAG: hypothetical protein WDW36_009726 [Sanguina aurantia]